MDIEPMAAQQSARGNLIYLLCLAVLFFLMSGSTSNPTLEKNALNLLDRRKIERQAFSNWLFEKFPTTNQSDSENNSDDSTTTVIIPSNDTVVDNNNGTTSVPQNMTFTPNLVSFPSSFDSYFEKFENETGPYSLHYHNVSGFIHGSWSAKVHADDQNSTTAIGTDQDLLTDNTDLQSENNQDTLSTSLIMTEKNRESGSESLSSEDSQQESNPNSTSSKPPPATPAQRRGNFPWSTNLERQATLNIREVFPLENQSEISWTKGTLSLEVEDINIELDVDALHYIPGGTFFMSARSLSLPSDIRNLINLVPEPLRNQSGHVILNELDNRIKNLDESIQNNRLTGGVGGDEIQSEYTAHCSFQGIGQLKSLPTSYPRWRLKEFEDELRQPTGRSKITPPPMTISLALYSKDCQVDLVINEAQGIKFDKFWYKTLNYAAALTLVLLIQTILLVKQMEYTSTRASIAKVSHGAVIIQTGMDGYTLGVHASLGTMIDNKASLPLLLPAFAACLCGCFFGSRYAGIIKSSEIPRPASTTPDSPPTPSPQEQQRQAAADAATRRAQNNNNNNNNGDGDDSNDTSSNNNNNNNEHDVHVDPSSDTNGHEPTPFSWNLPSLKYSRYVVLFTSIVILISFVGWLPLVLTAVYSFWLPQIYHSALRGYGRRGLLWKYVIGTTICRLFVPLYMWQCPENLLFMKSSNWVWLLVLYQVAQCGLLLLQDIFGPRFFLPKNFFPEGEQWDWHPILAPSDLESGTGPVGSNKVDCVICFEPIDLIAPNEKDDYQEDEENGHNEHRHSSEKENLLGGVGKGFNRFAYAVPPCYHIAHTSCLESWLQIKSECPLCRRHLPPL